MPPQHQRRQPGIEQEMKPRPEFEGEERPACNRLRGRVAVITGGDSGIGRAVAVAFAREGADVAIVYLDEHQDAREACRCVEEVGSRCLLVSGDVGDERFCERAIADTVAQLGRIDILVNNAAEQHVQENPAKITADQIERTFRTNIFSFFYMTHAALPHLGRGSAIINSTSVTAYRGSPHLIDYASTKGAIVAFTRSLSGAVAARGIRVNAVAPGPVWTPLIPSTFPSQEVGGFGTDVPLGRPGQPEEIAPSYVFLACSDSSYMTGQVLHPNGGEVING